MGLSDDCNYARYHQVLNRAVWSPREAARILLLLLLQHLDQGDGPLIFGIDETLERRRGPKIKSLGMYRDAVRSSRSHLVKASGLRWISLMWLAMSPGRDVIGPCPFSPCWRPRHATTGSADAATKNSPTGRARWSCNCAAAHQHHCCQSLAQPVTLIARLRLDAALYEPAPPRLPGQNGRPPLKGRRLPALKALLDLPTVSWVEVSAAWYTALPARWNSPRKRRSGTARASRPCPCAGSWFGTPRANSPHRLCCALTWAVDPVQILEWFVLRWQLEVTFQEVRAHLAWRPNASGRTAPSPRCLPVPAGNAAAPTSWPTC